MNLNKLNCLLNLLLAVLCAVLAAVAFVYHLPAAGVVLVLIALVKLLQAWVDYKKDIEEQARYDW